MLQVAEIQSFGGRYMAARTSRDGQLSSARSTGPDTPLGAISTWPQSRKTVVDLILHSRLPMFVLLGSGSDPDLQRSLHRDHRSKASGRDWTAEPRGMARGMGPSMARFSSGFSPERPSRWKNSSSPDARQRGHDAAFSIHCSPLHDESGAIAGILVTMIDTAPRSSPTWALAKSGGATGSSPKPCRRSFGRAMPEETSISSTRAGSPIPDCREEQSYTGKWERGYSSGRPASVFSRIGPKR